MYLNNILGYSKLSCIAVGTVEQEVRECLATRNTQAAIHGA